MNIPIHFCNQTTELQLPGSCEVASFAPPEERLVPLDSNNWLHTGELPGELREFLQAPEKLLIIVNDQYRPTPTASVLRALSKWLQPERLTILIATALHEPPTDDELRVILGSEYQRLLPCTRIHDAFTESELARFAGQSSEVELNSLLAAHDRILTIGSVEPHYFAGFTGGRKIILPGCASFADTQANHAEAVAAASRPLATSGNPVWEDIQCRTACLDDKERLTIQLVTGHGGTVLFAAVGDWDQAYRSASEFVRDNFAHAQAKNFDIVISVVYPPLDRNLYQLQKSYENVAAVVRDGGTILLISGCLDGVGDDRFLKLAESLTKGEEPADLTAEAAAMGIHKVKRTLRLAKRIDLVLVSTLPAAALRHLPITAKQEINDTVQELINRYGRECRIAVVLDSASQVLYKREAGTAGSARTMEEKDYA